jgi:hypothetical protein
MLKKKIVLLALLSALALAAVGMHGAASFHTQLAGPVLPPIGPPPGGG